MPEILQSSEHNNSPQDGGDILQDPEKNFEGAPSIEIKNTHKGFHVFILNLLVSKSPSDMVKTLENMREGVGNDNVAPTEILKVMNR